MSHRALNVSSLHSSPHMRVRAVASLSLSLLAFAFASCAGTPPAPMDPAVAERTRAAGLVTDAAREEAAREAAALARRAPRMAYPILVPSDPGEFRLDGATVDDDGEAVYYALRYRRPDGACFTVAGGGDEMRRPPSGERDSAAVEVRALHRPAFVFRVREGLGGPAAPGRRAGDVISGPIEADGLAVTFSSVLDEERDCRPITLEEAVGLVAGLRPLDPADDLPGAYRPIDVSELPGPTVGDDSEDLAVGLFAPAGSSGDVTVETVRRTNIRAVVLVTRRGSDAGDIQDEEIRAVFVHTDDGDWRLVSAGTRFRCRPGRGHPDWSPDPCG